MENSEEKTEIQKTIKPFTLKAPEYSKAFIEREKDYKQKVGNIFDKFKEICWNLRAEDTRQIDVKGHLIIMNDIEYSLLLDGAFSIPGLHNYFSYRPSDVNNFQLIGIPIIGSREIKQGEYKIVLELK